MGGTQTAGQGVDSGGKAASTNRRVPALAYGLPLLVSGGQELRPFTTRPTPATARVPQTAIFPLSRRAATCTPGANVPARN